MATLNARSSIMQHVAPPRPGPARISHTPPTADADLPVVVRRALVALATYRCEKCGLGNWRPRSTWGVLAPALLWLGLVALLPGQPAQEHELIQLEASTELDAQAQANRSERLRLFSEALLWPFGLSPAEAQPRPATRSLRRGGC